MDFQDINTTTVKHVSIEVNDHEFHFLLVSWDDVKKIVKEESINKADVAKLNEFES